MQRKYRRRLNHIKSPRPGRGGAYGKSGVGDKVACICGYFWNIEVKRPGKEPTAIQTRRMDEVRKAGGQAVAGTAEVVIQALTDWLAVRGIVV